MYPRNYFSLFEKSFFNHSIFKRFFRTGGITEGPIALRYSKFLGDISHNAMHLALVACWMTARYKHLIFFLHRVVSFTDSHFTNTFYMNCTNLISATWNLHHLISQYDSSNQFIIKIYSNWFIISVSAFIYQYESHKCRTVICEQGMNE